MKIGKTSQKAILVVNCLAEHYSEQVMMTSAMVAREVSISQPLVAKILSVLSHAEILRGFPGPGGGYELSRSPEEVKFLDVVSCFDQQDPHSNDYSGSLTSKFKALEDVVREFLAENDFAIGTMTRPV